MSASGHRTTDPDGPEIQRSIIELCGGEDPTEFLTGEQVLVFGLIAGMSDLDRIEGWRRAARDHTNRHLPSVHNALDRQEQALEAGERPPIYHPIHGGYESDTDPRRVCDETPHDEEDEVPAEGHTEAHPEANLEAGEVLVVDREDSTEYVWPARADADEPYLFREVVDGDVRQEMAIGQDDAFRRLAMDPEKHRVDDVVVDAPLEAAVNGGGRDV